MFRKFISSFLIAVMTASSAFPALAAVATPENTGSWENVASASNAGSWDSDVWDFDSDIFDLDSDSLFWQQLDAQDSSRAADIVNTVDYSSCVLSVRYYDMSNVLHSKNTTFNSNGHAILTRPDDFAKPYGINLYLNSGSLPPSGKYTCEIKFMSDTGGFTYSNPYIYLYQHLNNASTEYKNIKASLSQFSGDFSTSFSLDRSQSDQVRLTVQVSSDFGFPYGGYLKVNFTRIPSSSDVDITVGEPPSSNDLQQDTANNTGQIANNTSQMAETLKEIVQTISNQLAALWDQMFNLIHLPEMLNWDQNTQKIIDALQGELNIQIDNDNEIAIDIMDNDDKNTDAIIKNDDKNTDRITNGYDNSKFKDQNNKLDSAINEYDQAEDAVLSSVSGYLEGFQMPSYSSVPSGVLTACIYYGNYLQRLFEAIGFFNFPITLSLTMVFVLMLVGYHRFRAG